MSQSRPQSGDWQMMTPDMSAECEAFGANDTVSVGGWAGGKVASGGDYAWTLWRPYSCCQIKGIFLGFVDVFPYP